MALSITQWVKIQKKYHGKKRKKVMKNYFSKVLIFRQNSLVKTNINEFPYKINDIKIVIFRFSFLFFQIFIHCVKRKCKRTRLHHYSKQGIYLVIRFFSGVRKNFGHFLFSLQRTIYIWVIIRTFSDLLVNCFFFLPYNLGTASNVHPLIQPIRLPRYPKLPVKKPNI